MSFDHTHDGQPCFTQNCALLSDQDKPETTGPELEEAADESGLADYMVAMSREFDVRTAERHQMGATKYGPAKFLTADTIEMALEEILDLANYARYTFMKLRLLQDSLREQVPDGPINTGFITAADATGVKEESK